MSLHPRQSLHAAAMGHNAALPNQQHSVTEQIMQLDQAITLTLQEIDQNFATAHQIVTSRILPAVKEYGVASARVWQGAKFWKTFYEVSANVSLTAHVQTESEFDANSQQDDATQTGNDSRENATFTSDHVGRSPRSEAGSVIYTDMDASIASDSMGADEHDAANESVEQAPADRARAASPPRFSNASMAAAARREAARGKQQKPGNREDQGNIFDPSESPFERLRRDITTDLGRGMVDPSMDQSSFLASSKAGAKGAFGNREMERDRAALAQGIEKLGSTHAARGGRHGDPDSSNISSLHEIPKFKASSKASAGRMKTSSTPKKDALLNKVLDSEHKRNKGRLSYTKIQATPRSSQSKSNPFAPPNVRMWDGIVDLRKTPLTSKIKGAKSSKAASGSKQASSKAEDDENWDSDSSDKEDSLGWPAGMSPPVTMQFSVPQSRYAQTPAKEAAKMMVDDLLRSVGASSPAPRVWPKSSSKSRAGEAQAAHGASSRKQPVATPLRMDRKEPKQREKQSGGGGRRRDSIPTPPTLTKRGPSLAREATPSASQPGGSSANASSAALLMDADEGLELNEADAISAADVHQRFGGLNLKAVAPLPLDDDDDDDDDNDDDDESSESESEDGGDSIAGSMLSSAAKYSVSSNSRSGNNSQPDNSGWTSSTISSFNQPKQAGRSIEDDTLFGVRAPAEPRTAAAGRGTRGTSSSSAVPARSIAAATGDARGDDSFKVWGHVDEMGTVHGGRPLVDRDDTYSAPSPTPLNMNLGPARR